MRKKNKTRDLTRIIKSLRELRDSKLSPGREADQIRMLYMDAIYALQDILQIKAGPRKPPETKENVLALIRQGYTYRHIIERHKVGKDYIYFLKKELGLVKPRKSSGATDEAQSRT